MMIDLLATVGKSCIGTIAVYQFNPRFEIQIECMQKDGI